MDPMGAPAVHCGANNAGSGRIGRRLTPAYVLDERSYGPLDYVADTSREFILSGTYKYVSVSLSTEDSNIHHAVGSRNSFMFFI